jgi:oxygen-dependent protoporphyrinogen oxidase
MRVAVVGGGITGLAAAWELQCRGIDYVLLEASDRLGGKIVTERVDGFVIEGAADSFLTQKPWAWQLSREIGLGDRLIGTNDAQRSVYVLRHDKLHPMPRGMRLIVPLDADGLQESELLSPEGKRRMLAEPQVPARREDGDESLASFVRRRFGEEALEVFGDSLLAGIYVGDSERLSLQATFPNYAALENAHGSVTRGMLAATPEPRPADTPASMFVSFPTGVSELVEGLQARLTGDLRPGTPVSRLDPDGTVRTTGGEGIGAGAVILTVPPQQAGNLLRGIAPELAHELGEWRTESSAVVSLGFRAEQLGRPLDGFGFVVPHTEPTRLLACTWSSTKLPHRAPEGHVLLRAFFGGPWHAFDAALSDDELVGLALAELRPLLDIGSAPVLSRVSRWRDANPQYDVGHLERMARLRSLCPPWLHLAGCAYGGAGIPDCVRQGRDAARAALRSL